MVVDLVELAAQSCFISFCANWAFSLSYGTWKKPPSLFRGVAQNWEIADPVRARVGRQCGNLTDCLAVCVLLDHQSRMKKQVNMPLAQRHFVELALVLLVSAQALAAQPTNQVLTNAIDVLTLPGERLYYALRIEKMHESACIGVDAGDSVVG